MSLFLSLYFGGALVSALAEIGNLLRFPMTKVTLRIFFLMKGTRLPTSKPVPLFRERLLEQIHKTAGVTLVSWRHKFMMENFFVDVDVKEPLTTQWTELLTGKLLGISLSIFKVSPLSFPLFFTLLMQSRNRTYHVWVRVDQSWPSQAAQRCCSPKIKFV